MAKTTSKASTAKKSSTAKKETVVAQVTPTDPNADIKSCTTLGELFDLRPEDTDSVRFQVWKAKGLFLAREAGVKFGPK